MKAVRVPRFGGPEVLELASLPIHCPAPARCCSTYGPPR